MFETVTKYFEISSLGRTKCLKISAEIIRTFFRRKFLDYLYHLKFTHCFRPGKFRVNFAKSKCKTPKPRWMQKKTWPGQHKQLSRCQWNSLCFCKFFALNNFYFSIKNQTKSSLYSWYSAEACSEWRGPSPRFSARSTTKLQSGGEPLVTVLGLTDPEIESKTFLVDSEASNRCAKRRIPQQFTCSETIRFFALHTLKNNPHSDIKNREETK